MAGGTRRHVADTGAQDQRSAKQALRGRVLAARAALPERVRRAGDRARDAALADLLAGAAGTASYASFGTEPGTLGHLRPGHLLPVLRSDHDLDWTAYDGRLPADGPRLGPGALAACDLVLVPALVVDRTGARLGRGGGSYDRALTRATGLLVALLHDGELVDDVPTQAHDVRVHAVATPGGLVRLRA